MIREDDAGLRVRVRSNVIAERLRGEAGPVCAISAMSVMFIEDRRVVKEMCLRRGRIWI